MTALTDRVRGLIADPSGASQVFDDTAVAEALNRYRVDVVQDLLQPSYVRTATGAGYNAFRHPSGLPDWSDAALEDAQFGAVTANTPDLQFGQWTFTTARRSPILWITGTSYDVFGAAAELLEQWAATVKLEFGFSSDGQRFDRQHKHKMLLDLAVEYRKRQRPRTASMVRSDTEGGGGVSDPQLAWYHQNLKPFV